MKGVVHLVDTNPIDLTASIIRAYIERKNGNDYAIEWVLDSSANPNIISELEQLSQPFITNGFNIKVKHQNTIPEFNPNPEETKRILTSIASPFVGEEIRIHHGALCVDGIRDNFRCFSLSDTGDLFLLSDSKNKDSRIKIKFDKSLSTVKCIGSLNLINLVKYGEIVHLPWYCLSTNISPFVVQEVISTPEGCAVGHFSSGIMRHNPSGYSLYDYSDGYTDVDFTSKYLMDKLIEYGSVIGYRTKKVGDNSFNKIIIGEVNKTFIRIEQLGFLRFIQNEFQSNIVNVEDCIQSLCNIIVVARICERVDRGYGDQVKKFGIESIPQGITVLLKSQLKKCYCHMEVNWDSALDSTRHLGLFARTAMEKGNIYLQKLIACTFYEKKATLPSLLFDCGTVDSLLQTIENLVENRKEKYITVTGSIFELC